MIATEVKYKKTGIDWMPEIPEHWRLIRLRFLCSITTGKKNTEDRIEDGDYPFFVRSQTIERINSYSFEGEGILTAGDGVGVGKVFHYVNEKFDFHQRVYLLFDFEEDINGKFLFYYLQTFLITELMRYNSKSTVDSIRLPILKDFIIPIPPKEEQFDSVLFVDNQTKKINHFIQTKQRFIELLKEQRQSIITHAVTKGIDENVKMKETALGEIPEHWEVRRLKFCLNEKLKYGANAAGDYYNPTWYRYIRITDFTADGTLNENNKLSLSPENGKDYELKDGDILLARSGATVGKSFQFKSVDREEKCCYAGYLIKASPNEELILSDFLYNFTLTSNYENWKGSILIKATIENISADKYSNLLIPIPTIKEQKRILEHIKSETRILDIAINKAEREIELMKEFREAMIAEAVTGKKIVNSHILG